MAKKRGNGSLRLYKAYNFRDKDPVIDQLRTMAEDTYGVKVNGKSLKQIEKGGGPSAACMRAWFFGTTRRPQNPTIEAAGRAMGFQRVWQRMK
jgi:hypothetical protein